MEEENEKKNVFSFCISLVFSIFALNIGNQKWAYEFY